MTNIHKYYITESADMLLRFHTYKQPTSELHPTWSTRYRFPESSTTSDDDKRNHSL